MIIRLCKKCKNPIPKHKDSRTIYCSKRCAGTEKITELRKCARKDCNNLIPIYKDHRQKYCSHSCSAIVHNEGKKKIKFCLYCNKKLESYQKKFCSHKHQWLFNIEFKIKHNYHVEQSSARKYYIYVRGHKCEECGLAEWRGKPIFISLHHINGDCQDHSPSNVKLECGNCHPLTDTFGSKNEKGKGRRINNKRNKKLYKLS